MATREKFFKPLHRISLRANSWGNVSLEWLTQKATNSQIKATLKRNLDTQVGTILSLSIFPIPSFHSLGHRDYNDFADSHFFPITRYFPLFPSFYRFIPYLYQQGTYLGTGKFGPCILELLQDLKTSKLKKILLVPT